VAANPVRVRRADGAESGLANIVQQFLEQNLEESEQRRRRARRLRGRIAMTAADHEITVTLDFRGDEIVIWDGAQEPLQASIAGPYSALVKLLQGEGNPLLEHLRGQLRVRSGLRHPFFPLRVHGLMKLSPQARGREKPRGYLLAAGLVAAMAAAVFLLLRS
jgi:SCP-2 sterol transfer family